jgi:hypothetical protein
VINCIAEAEPMKCHDTEQGIEPTVYFTNQWPEEISREACLHASRIHGTPNTAFVAEHEHPRVERPGPGPCRARDGTFVAASTPSLAPLPPPRVGITTGP